MAEIGSGLVKVDVSWTQLKAIVSSKKLALQYDESANSYDIFAIDGSIIYYIKIFTGSVPDTVNFNQTTNDNDKLDFETNFKNITTNNSTSPSAAVDGALLSTTNPVVIAGSDGTNIRAIRTDSSGRQLISGLGTAGTPSGGVISIQGVAGGTTVPVSGSITATNPSVSTNNSAIPSSSTIIGGSDGTNLQAVRVYDTNSSGSNEYTLGVNLRKSTSTGSVELGIENNPLVIQVPEYYKTTFGEIKTVYPYTLFDMINKYEIDSREIDNLVGSGGSVVHQPNNVSIRCSVNTTAPSYAGLRTNTYFRYQAGKSQIIKLTVVHANAGVTNQVRQWGYYDDNDGLFFQLSGTSLRLVRRSSVSGSVVDTAISQASWNRDPLDGTGSSGVTIDVTKGNIYEIDFQWLGVGTVRFFINGILIHVIEHANLLTTVYMKTAQLPLSWEIFNTAVSTASSFDVICASILSEGGALPPHYAFSASNASDIVVTTTERPVLSIRPKLTYNSIENRMLIIPSYVYIRTEGARLGWRIIMNATLTGSSFNSVNATSGVEFDVAATAFSGGESLFVGFLPNSNDSGGLDLTEIFNMMGRKLRRKGFAATVDSLTVTAINEATGNTNVRASLTWDEIK